MGIISFIISVAVLILVLKIIALPFKIIIKFIINSVVAGIILAVLAYFGVFVTLNIGTIILVGLLGIPGLIIGLIITMLV